ncbi:hypothetical protein, partial [Chromobacterium haemolyticum]|uniref:hypothetical protein n=1 Tax=Chromobacterium haemolyticum TaxID=394935 RepID=UPI001EE64FFD
DIAQSFEPTSGRRSKGTVCRPFFVAGRPVGLFLLSALLAAIALSLCHNDSQTSSFDKLKFFLIKHAFISKFLLILKQNNL